MESIGSTKINKNRLLNSNGIEGNYPIVMRSLFCTLKFWRTIKGNVWPRLQKLIKGRKKGSDLVLCLLYSCKNGVQVNSGTLANSIAVGQNFRLGADVNIPGERLNGKIYNQMVYNRALTADEITTNFNALRNRYGI